ncbi:MAG TPA: class I SAM-dependent methyltransferase [Planctomycetaceae bacterium]|jgi:SAM-dependent methyltransferase|nr:class I SAM-dependent methyltransferase [Planctomycetaceae bacterium]
MSIDDRLVATAPAQSQDDLLSPTSSDSEFGDSDLATATEVRESNAFRPATPGVEIDVENVVAHLRRGSVPSDQDLPDFSLECSVVELEPGERHLVAVDECPVCGGEWARARFGLPGARMRIVDCTSCGLGRLHPRPGPEMIERFYPASYYGVTGAKFVPLIEGLVRLVGARHVRALSRGLHAGARVLDVGCGRGVLLSALARRGFEAHGFEMSPSASTGVDPNAIVRFGKNLEEAGYPSTSFDQVIVWHVLEHIPDPRRTLDEIRRILKPGGRLVVAVPNYSSLQAQCCGAGWFHLDPPRHLYHFPAAGLRQLLESTGFQVGREHHFSLRQNPFGWVQSVLNCVPELPRNGLYSLLKRRDDCSPLCDRMGRLVLYIAYWLGMPAAAVQSVVDALLRRGASICLEARSRVD